MSAMFDSGCHACGEFSGSSLQEWITVIWAAFLYTLFIRQ